MTTIRLPMHPARRLRPLFTILVLAGACAAATPAFAGLREARAALDAGQFDVAAREYEAVAAQGVAAGRAGVGRVLLRRRQLPAAMEAFQLAQKMDPTFAEAYWGQGEVLRRQEQWAEAMPLLEKAVELDRKFPEAQLALGECLVQTKQYDRAIEAYSTGLKWGPKWAPRFLVGLGTVETARESLRDAAIYFTRAREQAPDDPDVRRALGDFYYGRGTWPLAILEYQAAMELDTADAELNYQLGQALYYDKRYNEALEQYRLAVERNPDFAPAQLALGNILYLSGAADPRRYAEAREPLETYVKMEPEDPKGLGLLGRTLYYLRDRDAAVETMARAAAMGEKSKEFYTVLGRAYADKREWNKALAAFEKGEPGPKEALIVAQIMAFTGQAGRADSVYQAVIARDSMASDARFALNELGKMRFAAKDWSGALGYFQRRISLDPNNGEAYYFSGLSYKQMEQSEAAVAALRQASVLDSTKADRFFWLGVVHDAAKDTERARAAFTRAVSLDSTSKLMCKAYSQLGYYGLLEKDWSGAARWLDQAVAICPEDLQSQVWRGQAYQNAGNCGKALAAYRRALEINPGQPDALKGVKSCSGGNGGPSASKGGGE